MRQIEVKYVLDVLSYNELPNEIKGAFEEAIRLRHNAVTPFYHFAVGAADLTKSGQIWGGCNLETAAAHGSHAERTSSDKAMTNEGPTCQIVAVAVVLGPESHEIQWPPAPIVQPMSDEEVLSFNGSCCGDCRDLLWNRSGGNREMQIHYLMPSGEILRVAIGNHLPNAFGLGAASPT